MKKSGKKGGKAKIGRTGGSIRKRQGMTKKGGGNGMLSERKRFGAGGNGQRGRAAHQAVHLHKKVGNVPGAQFSSWLHLMRQL